MANENDKVLFSAEFDSAPIVAGANEAVKGFTAMTNSQTELNQELATTTKNLDESNKKLKENQDAIAGLDKSTASYAGGLAFLTNKQKDLQNVNNQLKTTFDQQSKQYTDITAKVNAMSAAVAKSKDTHQNFVATLGQDIPFNAQSLAPLVSSFKQGINDAFGDVNTSGFGEFTAKLQSAGGEFEKLQVLIDAVNEKLKGVRPGSEEFENLTRTVKAAQDILNVYNESLGKTATAVKGLAGPTQAVNENIGARNRQGTAPGAGPDVTTVAETEGKIVSLRTRIIQLRSSLVSLSEAGKENTKEYKDQEVELVKLTARVNEQDKAIHVLASETKAFDFGLAAVRAAGAGFEIVSGTLNVLGIDSSTAEEAQRHLLGAMALVNGVREIQLQLSKEGTLLILGEKVATDAYAASQKILTVVLGTSVATSKALNAALIATGVGALVVGIGLLSTKLLEYHDSINKTELAEKNYNTVLEGSASAYTKAFVEVNHLREQIELAKEGFVKKSAVLKEYNTTIGLTTGQVSTLDQAEKELEKNADAYIRFTLLKAAANVALGKAAEEAFKVELKVNETGSRGNRLNVEQRAQVQFATKAAVDAAQKAGADSATLTKVGIEARNKAIADIRAPLEQANQKSFEDIAKEFLEAAKNITKDFHFKFDPDTINKVVNVYKDELRKLNDKLREVTKSDKTTFISLQQDISEKLVDALEGIDKLVKQKKLTKGQGIVLELLLNDIANAETDKAVKEFGEKMKDASVKISDEITSLRLAESTKRVANIRDTFEKERIQIELDAAQTKFTLSKERADLLKQVDTAEKFGLITPENAIQGREKIKQAFAQLLEDLIVQTNNRKGDLAFAQFNKAVDVLKSTSVGKIIDISADATRQVENLASLFQKGAITFQTYQRRLTQILQTEAAKRREEQKKEILAELELAEARLKAPDLSTEQTEKLQAQVQALKQALSNISREIATATATDTKTTQDNFLNQLNTWVQTIGNVITSIGGFWQQVNQAEQASLDRSIAIQQKRVDNAKELADKGNVAYLQLEQDRLDKLQLKREEAARKQLAIDNVLRLSQATLAAVSAVAKAAETGGVIEAIAAGIAIIGVIASAYAFAQSLQPNSTAGFYQGKEFVDDTRAGAGTDTIPARLTKGERVITNRENKDYWDTLTAVHNRKIPAKVLNDFVNNYGDSPNYRVNYDRVADATDSKSSLGNAILAEKLTTVNDKLDAVVTGLANLGVNVNVDENGLAISVHNSVRKMNLTKRS